MEVSRSGQERFVANTSDFREMGDRGCRDVGGGWHCI